MQSDGFVSQRRRDLNIREVLMKDINNEKHRVKSERKCVMVSTPGCVYTQESRTPRAQQVPKSRNTSQEDSAHRRTGWTSPSAR